MNEPFRIRRMAIQLETVGGDYLHIYSEDPAVVTLERKVEYMGSLFLEQPFVVDAETIIEISGLRSYRITKGRPFDQPDEQKEIEGQKEIVEEITLEDFSD